MPRPARKLTEETKLGPGGRALWDETLEDHPDLDARQRVQLLEACRLKDRLDRIDAVLRGDKAAWLQIGVTGKESGVYLVVDNALSQATSMTNMLKQTIAAMRLPDANGKKPAKVRNAGVYPNSGSGGKVSSLERMRQRAAGG